MAELKAQYDETIRQLVPIFSLSAHYQSEIIQRSQIIDLAGGKYLFKQGDRDEFTYYLLTGELEMRADGQVHSHIRSGSDSARYPLAQLQPRQFSACAVGGARILQVNRAALDKLLVLEQQQKEPDGGHLEVSDLEAGDDADWMTRMLQSALFSRLPTTNIQRLFTVLEPVEFKSGEQVVEQHGPGDYYYIIQEGRCRVSRRSSGGEDIELAELRPGDGFGEEALLSNATRNASVRMLSDGVLMRMNREDFLELIKKPALSALDYASACHQVNRGAQWLDVRLAEEYQQSCIDGSVNLPLASLRADTSQLAADRHYIVYCDSGGRSSVAAFLLTQRGFQVSYLDGGLMHCPSSDLTAGPAHPESPAEPDDAALDAEVRAYTYEAEATVTRHELESAARHDSTENDEGKRAEYAAMAEKLRREHAQLEAARKRAAEEAERYRQQEEAKIQQLREDAEKQLREQKQKLESIYARNTEEMERLRAMKQAAESQIRAAREKAEAESQEARRRMQEADSIKQQLHDARVAIEQEAEQQRRKQEEMERKIQAAAQSKLEAERQNLAEQYQRSSEALEQAQREKAAAEAARQAANEEAQRIITEFKEAHAKARAEEEARLQAERDKLEQQSRELRESMAAIEQTRHEAEAARRSAETQLEKLKSKRAQQKNREDSQLQQRVQAAEAQANRARADLAQADEAQKAVEAARQNNIRGLEKQSRQEEKLRAQIENEVSEWLEASEMEAPTAEEMEKQAEHMRRIKARAEAAKKQSQSAARNLLDDVARQLGDDSQ